MNNQFEKEKDPTWDKLSAKWTASDGENLLARSAPDNQASIAQIKKEVKTSTRRDLLNSLVGLIVSGFIISEIVKGLPSFLDVIFYYGLLVIVTGGVVANLWFTRSNLKSQTSNTKSYIELSLDHINTQLKVNQIGKFTCIAILLLFYSIVAFILFHMVTSWQNIAKPVMGASIVGFVSLFFPAVLYFIHKEKIKLLAQKQSLTNMLKNLA